MSIMLCPHGDLCPSCAFAMFSQAATTVSKYWRRYLARRKLILAYVLKIQHKKQRLRNLERASSFVLVERLVSEIRIDFARAIKYFGQSFCQLMLATSEPP